VGRFWRGTVSNVDVSNMGYRDYAVWASLTAEELARECEVQVFRASGPGGQGVNTTDSAVRMRHVPRPPKQRKPTKPSKAAKARRLANKRHRAQVKACRRRPGAEE